MLRLRSPQVLLSAVLIVLVAFMAPVALCAEDPVVATAPPLQITVNENGISIHAVAVQADELFTMLARQAGVGIIVDDTVGRRDAGKFTSRKLTVHLTNRKITEVIENICAAYGLSHSRMGDVFMISEGIPKNPSSYLMSDIDSVTTQYVLASNAKSLLPVFLQDHVKVNQEQNAVILSAPAEVLAKFREDIKQFDVPASQIMIDVLMVELTDSGAKDLGMDLSWSNAGRSVSSSTSAGGIILQTLSTLPIDFTARIHALVEKKKARVHANPRIATVSGQKASIFVGRQKYLSQSVDIADDSGYARSTNYIAAGISLEITPWTGGDGVITADIQPEVSVMSTPDPITKLPEKSTRRASTMVRVRDGDTVIIGGLFQNELQSRKTRVPVLGSLPLIGGIFRGVSHSETKTELVIFITPHILSQTGHLPVESEQKLLNKLGSNITGIGR